MAGFLSASIYLKLGFVVSSLGILSHLIGLSTNFWFVSEVPASFFGIMTTVKVNRGLWRFCSETSGTISCYANSHVASWEDACRAFAILGFLAGIGALVLLVLYIFMEKARTKILNGIGIATAFASAGCIFLTIVIYGAKVKSNLSWSFYLSVIGMLLQGGAAVLIVLNKLRGGNATVNT